MLMHAINNGLTPILLAIKYGFQTTYDYSRGRRPGQPRRPHGRVGRRRPTDALRSISWAYVVAFFAAIALWLRHQRRVIARSSRMRSSAG